MSAYSKHKIPQHVNKRAPTVNLCDVVLRYKLGSGEDLWKSSLLAMHLLRLAVVGILCRTMATAMTLQLPPNETLADDIPLPFATNVAGGISTPGEGLRIQCDGNRYGKKLNVKSCQKVFDYMPENDTQNVFAERHSGVYHDLPLPWRILGGEWRISQRNCSD